MESASDVAELGDGEEKGESEGEISEEVEGEEETLEEAELLAEASEGELDDEGELPAEDAAGAEGEVQPGTQEAAPDDDCRSRSAGRSRATAPTLCASLISARDLPRAAVVDAGVRR